MKPSRVSHHLFQVLYRFPLNLLLNGLKLLDFCLVHYFMLSIYSSIKYVYKKIIRPPLQNSFFVAVACLHLCGGEKVFAISYLNCVMRFSFGSARAAPNIYSVFAYMWSELYVF